MDEKARDYAWVEMMNDVTEEGILRLYNCQMPFVHDTSYGLSIGIVE